MKKLVIIILAALTALVICAAALANDTAVELYNKITGLLFSTHNVTLTASAEFSLDGNWFKTAEGTWKQDDTRSYRKLHLRSPRADGTERQNGYVIVTEGNDLYLLTPDALYVYDVGEETLERIAEKPLAFRYRAVCADAYGRFILVGGKRAERSALASLKKDAV